MGSQLTFLVMLVLWASFEAQIFACSVWKDHYILFTNSSSSRDTIQLDIWSSGRVGWLGISFQQERNTTGSIDLMLIASPPHNVTFVGGHMANTSVIPQGVNVTWDSSIGVTMDNIVHFVIQAPYSLLAPSKYIHFAKNYYDTPKSLLDIQPHNEIGVKISPLRDGISEFGLTWCSPTYLRLPGRLPAWHMGLYIPWMIFYGLIFLTMIAFRNHQPLKSRGIGPFIVTACIALNLTQDFVINAAWTFEEQSFFLCYTTGFILYPLAAIISLIPTQYFFRYLVLLNTNVFKQEMIQTRNTEDQKVALLPLYLRLLNKLNHPIVSLVYYILYMGMYFVITIIIFSGYGWKCGAVSTAMRWFAFAQIFIFVLPVLLMQIWDILVNIKKFLSCKLRDYYITTDHYMHRLELVPVVLVLIFGILWVVAPVPTMIKITFCELMYLSIMLNLCVFVVLATVLRWIQSECRKKDGSGKDSTRLNLILQDPEALGLFTEFCKYEFSLENLYFELEVIHYKNASDGQKTSIANEMYAKFLTSSSPFEVNCTQANVTVFKEKISKNELDQALCDPLEAEILANLRDTMMRFVSTRAFMALTKKYEMLGKSMFNESKM